MAMTRSGRVEREGRGLLGLSKGGGGEGRGGEERYGGGEGRGEREGVGEQRTKHVGGGLE